MTPSRRPDVPGHDHAAEDHDLGLGHDLPRLLGRRRALGLAAGLGAGLGAGALGACAAEDGTPSPGAGTASPTPRTTQPATQPATPSAPPGTPESPLSSAEPLPSAAGGEIPEETAGPFPADGSNGPDVLTDSGAVRRDLRRSFGAATGVAAGLTTTLRFRVYDLDGDDVSVLPGAALYAWHCDRDGAYSLYNDPITAENYLRGVQVADRDGWLSFTTIFPGCYPGRWPHVHFEVYRTLDDATTASGRLRTSQLAIPEAVCRAVYGRVPGYEASAGHLDRLSLESDLVFADGYSLQLARVSGDLDRGLTLSLNVPV